jgi:hypothetical protein
LRAGTVEFKKSNCSASFASDSYPFYRHLQDQYGADPVSCVKPKLT